KEGRSHGARRFDHLHRLRSARRNFALRLRLLGNRSRNSDRAARHRRPDGVLRSHLRHARAGHRSRGPEIRQQGLRRGNERRGDGATVAQTGVAGSAGPQTGVSRSNGAKNFRPARRQAAARKAMTLRRKSREFALQMLFEWDMAHQKPKQIEQHFWKQARAADSTRKFADQLFEGAIAQAAASDALVEKLSQNWKFERLAAVDRNILRLAIYEFKSGTAPVKVVIDEALELAKKFSSAESPNFLNGILDAAYKNLQS